MDHQYYQRELASFEQDIWKLFQYSRSLQDFRDEISQGWDDNASREINGKYLNNHSEDSEKFIENLNSQRKYLEEFNSLLIEISKSEEEIYSLSREINMLGQQSKTYIQNSYSFLDSNIEKKHDARMYLKKANEIIEKVKSLE